MAGESSRFRQAGFTEPKFRLAAHGAPVFDHAVNSFAAYFQSDSFLFVLRDAEAEDFVRARCATLGIAHAVTIRLHRATAGQAETVQLGLDLAGIGDDESISIFNIDTFRPGYRKPPQVSDPDCAGYLEVFRGSGEGWSFVATDPRRAGAVAEVAEKKAISDLCCTGLYHFRRAGDFRWAYRNPSPPKSEAELRERYVAPLYNPLIACGFAIRVQLIDSSEVIFCGTPDEYAQVVVSGEIGRRLVP
jgi:CTP:molybdopterin cytidylyltransferase MocA